jgi:hypothetical protein
MGSDERRKIERSGAFLSGDGFANIAVPIRTLSDDYHDTPEAQDSDRVPEPAPEGRLTRLVHAATGRHPRQDH